MDFADDSDLYQKILKMQKANQYFEEREIWAIFIQMVRALNVLHSRKILHRDLKSANVFLSSTCQIRGFKRFKSGQERTFVYTDWHTLLCLTGSMERSALRQ
jgi:serine/threonine protein kinase